MDDLRERIGRENGVESVVLNVLQIGYMFDTWRDKLLPRTRASSLPAKA
jgi:hypothetical protein